jgi:hypothetical protein
MERQQFSDMLALLVASVNDFYGVLLRDADADFLATLLAQHKEDLRKSLN